MIGKRLVGVITVRRKMAVQSFGYARWLPMGDPAVVARNLDRWGADEILVLATDRGNDGPDFPLLERLTHIGLSTPLIYGGGIRKVEDGIAVVGRGADRIALDSALARSPHLVAGLASALGAQALVAALPLAIRPDGLFWRDHAARTEHPFPAAIRALLEAGHVSEVLVIDWQNEGFPGRFDTRLLDLFPVPGMPLILFGGLGLPEPMQALLARPEVRAVGVGNSLAWREHAVQLLKAALPGAGIRPPAFAGSEERP
jgi:cyclase